MEKEQEENLLKIHGQTELISILREVLPFEFSTL